MLMTYQSLQWPPAPAALPTHPAACFTMRSFQRVHQWHQKRYWRRERGIHCHPGQRCPSNRCCDCFLPQQTSRQRSCQSRPQSLLLSAAPAVAVKSQNCLPGCRPLPWQAMLLCGWTRPMSPSQAPQVADLGGLTVTSLPSALRFAAWCCRGHSSHSRRATAV